MPKQVESIHSVAWGIGCLVTAVALTVITTMVAKGMIGEVRISGAGALTLNALSLLLTAVGTALFASGCRRPHEQTHA